MEKYEMNRACSTYRGEERRNVFMVLVGNFEGK
jgi:hypothetical protein